MSSLEWKQTKVKFLLDENVKKRLLTFLKSKGFDIIFKPKGLSNGKLAEFSKSEQRIFVTNDDDFLECCEDDIFCLVLLRIPQNNENLLIELFDKMLKEINPEKFKGNLIILSEGRIDISQLCSKRELSE